jgi:drug/metabolite transporter (DMT)-like permease
MIAQPQTLPRRFSTNTQTANTTPGSTATIVGAGVIFGSAFLCTKILVQELTVLQIVTARMFLGAAAVTAFMLLTGRLPKLTRGMLAGATVLALADALIPYLLISWGETRINSGEAAVLVSTTPLFTALFAQAIAREERVSPVKLGGLALGFAGVVVLASGSGGALVATPSAGAAAVVCAAVLYAAAAVYARRLLRRTDASTLNVAKLAIGVLLVVPFAFAIDGAPAGGALDARGIIAVLWLGMVSTGLARVAYFRAVAVAGSVRASLVTYVVPVSGVTLGVIVLGERLQARSAAGFALVIAGIALVMYGSAVRSGLARLALRARHAAAPPAAVARQGR